MKIAQFLLTRFNPSVRYASKDLGIDCDWLEHRFELFEKICLPSVASQVNSDFHWILMVSDRTPRTYVARLLKDLEAASFPSLILLVPRYSEDFFISAVFNCLGKSVDRVVSTRLDNDDAIARDYMADVRWVAGCLPREHNFVINLRQGCQVTKDGIFPWDLRLNPFLSLVSSPDNLSTAHAAPHRKMDRVGAVIDMSSSDPKWIQAIHSRNVENAPLASERCSEAYLQNFVLASDWRSCL